MCAVIGAVIKAESSFRTLRNVFIESKIRGKHATGLSYIKDGRIHTIIEKTSAESFIKNKSFKDYINDDGRLYLIGHIRYSTSDLKYNQPINSDIISIAHNGVISQDDPSKWKYVTDGKNDSELVLKSFEFKSHPLLDFPHSSQAVTALWLSKNEVRGFRNGKRPLWISQNDGEFFFTSTKDIATRSGLTDIQRCAPNTEYILTKDGCRVDSVKVLKQYANDIQP